MFSLEYKFYGYFIVALFFLQFSHLAWVQTERKSGGLGDLNYPLVSDVTKSISKAFNVLIEDQVHTYKLFINLWAIYMYR